MGQLDDLAGFERLRCLEKADPDDQLKEARQAHLARTRLSIQTLIEDLKQKPTSPVVLSILGEVGLKQDGHRVVSRMAESIRKNLIESAQKALAELEPHGRVR